MSVRPNGLYVGVAESVLHRAGSACVVAERPVPTVCSLTADIDEQHTGVSAGAQERRQRLRAARKESTSMRSRDATGLDGFE